MQQVDQVKGRDKAKYLFVEVVNTGDRPTTITQLICLHYTSALKRLWTRPDGEFLVPISSLGPALPYVLKPGERWTGGASQESLLQQVSAPSGYIYFGVLHSAAKRPALAKIRMKDLTR